MLSKGKVKVILNELGFKKINNIYVHENVSGFRIRLNTNYIMLTKRYKYYNSDDDIYFNRLTVEEFTDGINIFFSNKYNHLTPNPYNYFAHKNKVIKSMNRNMKQFEQNNFN